MTNILGFHVCVCVYCRILDSVIRAAYYKYFYPKEALVLDGVLNRSVAENAHAIALNAPSTKNKTSQNATVADKTLRAQVAR
jgi:hypothetical protein